MNKVIMKELPRTFNIISESNPILIKVYKRGSFEGLPIDETKTYVPEGTSEDIPRSFIANIPEPDRWTYRENVFLEINLRQRPVVLKYVLQKSPVDKLLIYTISKAGDLRRKVKEIDFHLTAIKRKGLQVSGLIILIPEDMLNKIADINWHVDAFISLYSYRR